MYCDEEVGELDSESWISDRRLESPSSSSYSPPIDDNTFDRLIDSELHFLPLSDYVHRFRDRFVDVTVRQDSINLILKVSTQIVCMKMYTAEFVAAGLNEIQCRCVHTTISTVSAGGGEEAKIRVSENREETTESGDDEMRIQIEERDDYDLQDEDGRKRSEEEEGIQQL